MAWESNYSNEGRNYSSPSGTPAGDTRSEGGGWMGGGFTSGNRSLDWSDQNLADIGIDPGSVSPPEADSRSNQQIENDTFSNDYGLGGYRAGMVDPGTATYSKATGPTTFDQLSPAEQAAYANNIAAGLPGWYDAKDKGFREKMVDGMNWGLNKSGLLGRSLKELGARPGQTFDEQRAFEKMTPGAAEARYARMNDVASGLVNMVTPMPVKIGINFAQNLTNGMSLADAAKRSVGDLARGYAVGAINKAAMPEIAKAIGVDGIKALNTYNTVASLANMGGAGVPTVPSPGAAIVGGIFGPPSARPQINASGQPMTDLQGDKMYGGVTAGGWSSGGGGRDAITPAPVAPVAPGNVIEEITPQGKTLTFDGAGMGRAIRQGAQRRSSK